MCQKLFYVHGTQQRPTQTKILVSWNLLLVKSEKPQKHAIRSRDTDCFFFLASIPPSPLRNKPSFWIIKAVTEGG